MKKGPKHVPATQTRLDVRGREEESRVHGLRCEHAQSADRSCQEEVQQDGRGDTRLGKAGKRAEKGNAPDSNPVLSAKEIEEICESLTGTTQSLEEVVNHVTQGRVESLDAVDVKTLAEIDEKVFCCEGCGWWCSTDELHNEDDQQLCDDCEEDND